MTERLQTGLFNAQSLAVDNSHQEIDEVHLFIALMDMEDSLIAAILEKTGLPAEIFLDELHWLLRKKPQVSGSGVEQGKLYITGKLQKLFVSAEKEMKQLHDEYMSVEHILMAALITDGSEIEAILRKYRTGYEEIIKAIKDIRGNQRVTSQNPEATYNALKKYGRDLVAEVKAGKLDPVIGRDAEIRHVIRM